MVYIIIIQARMGSTRLPGKVLKKLLDKEIVLWCYDRCLKSKATDVILATSENKENDVLESLCIEKNIKCYRGSEMDLLDRYFQISKKYYYNFLNCNRDVNKDVNKDGNNKSDLKVIRITSDCPFIDYEMINKMIDYYEENSYNYIINHNKDAITPEGSCIEIIDYESLEYLWLNEKDMTFREHATGLLGTINKYDNIIKIGRYSYLPSKEIIDYDKMRYVKVSIDTLEDYIQAQYIVNNFKDDTFSYLDVLIFLQSSLHMRL